MFAAPPFLFRSAIAECVGAEKIAFKRAFRLYVRFVVAAKFALKGRRLDGVQSRSELVWCPYEPWKKWESA
jgi:hypothetical protein